MEKSRRAPGHTFTNGSLLALLVCAPLLLCSCSGGNPAATPKPSNPSAGTALTAADVTSVIQNTVTSVNEPMVVAVTDRAGNVLAVYHTSPAFPTTTTGDFGQTVSSDDLAIGLARTASFFSNDQAPLSSRTVRYISGIHFPPGVTGTGNADLYGIENTNRGCTLSTNFLPNQSVPPAQALLGGPGLGVITGKANAFDDQPFAVNPGGVPLFHGGAVGGVGVVSTSPQVAEFAAFSGATNAGLLLTAAQLPPPGVVVIGGISVPFVNQTTLPTGESAGSATAYAAGTYSVAAKAGTLPPEGYLVGPNAGTMLSASDVDEIITNAFTTAKKTRAVIRLPPDSPAEMSIAVADLDGTLLGLYRMHDGTVFSIDVAASKARNVVWFSGLGARDLPGVPAGTAVTNRTISFGAQPLFPVGIDGSGPGPFFQVFQNDLANPCTQGSQPGAPNTNNLSGIVFFPGSLPLYRNGVLIGGLGVSGDGVDQDDFVTASAVNAACGQGGPCGIPDFQAAANIRADQVVIRNVRLPYQKFPRDPTN